MDGSRITNGLDLNSPVVIWGKLGHRIRAMGQHGHPSPRELAELVEDAMQRSGAPPTVSSYVGKRIRDEIVLGDGGRPANPWDRWAKALNLLMDVGLREAAFRMQGIRGPKARALEVVARGRSSTHTLRKRLKHDLHDLPPVLGYGELNAAFFYQALEELLAEGRVRPDPSDGLVWRDEEE